MRFSIKSPVSFGNAPSGDNKKWVLYGLIGGLMVFAVIVAIVLSNDKSGQIPKDTGEYFDEGSGETVSNPEGKSPESFSTTGDQIVYLGFSKLLDHGISTYQVEAVKTALVLYSRDRQEKINEASIFVATIKRTPFDRDSPDPTRSVTFDIKINRKDTYRATLQYISIKSAQLILAQNGTEVFRSTMIDPDTFTDEGEEQGDIYLPPEER